MKKAMLATTAAVALAAGMSIAAAQGTGGTSGATGAGSNATHGQAQKQSGTEQGKSGSAQRGEEKGQRTGQKSGEKNERMGQQPGEKNERTGAATERGGSDRLSQARSVHLSSEQRDHIKTVVTTNRTARIDNANFDVRVGVRVPRSVHIVALPEDIIRIVPQYRGFDFILVRNEILIIDPDTYEIVAVLPA